MEDNTLFEWDDTMLKQYVSGQLPEAQCRIIDEAMKQDPFLQEAVEGLRMVGSASQLDQTLHSIQEHIETRTGYTPQGTSRVIQMPRISLKALGAIAASIVLIGGTYLIASALFKSKDPIAQHITSDKAPEPKIAPISINEETKSNTDIIENSVDEKNSSSTITSYGKDSIMDQKTIVSKNVEDISMNGNKSNANQMQTSTPATSSTVYNWTIPTTTAATNEKSDASKKIIKGQVVDKKTKQPISGANVVSGSVSTITSKNGYYEIALDESVKELEISQSGYDDEAKAITSPGNKVINVELDKSFESTSKTESKPSATNKKTEEYTASSPDLQRGLELYSNNDYSRAITSFRNVLALNSNHAEANYFTAMSYVNLKQSSKALPYLNTLIAGNSKYNEDAKWQKAQILIQQGKMAEARPILESLKASTKYKARAEKILETK